LQDPIKFTQTGNFGVKIFHLATPGVSLRVLRNGLFPQHEASMAPLALLAAGLPDGLFSNQKSQFG
jgi:hypothetical protein